MNDDISNQANLIAEVANLRERLAALAPTTGRLHWLEAAVAHIDELIMITDAQLLWPGPHIVYVNPAFTTTTGYSYNEVVGQTPRILHGPATDRAVLDHLRASLTRGEPFVGETTNYRKDGQPFRMECSIHPLRAEDGQVAYFVSVQRDVTQQRALAQRVQESEDRLQTIAALSSDYIYALDVTPEQQLRLVWATDALARMAGYEADTLPTDDAWQALIHPADQAIMQQRVQVLLSGEAYRSEFRIITRSRETRWLRDNAYPQWDDTHGRVVRIIGGAQDITTYKQMEEVLQHSEAQYREVVEHAIAGIFQATPNGRYRTVNPALARLYGYESPEAMLQHITDIQQQLYVNPEQLGALLEQLEQHGAVAGFETQVYRANKQVIWISQSVRAVRDSDGGLLYYEGFVEDISTRKAAELALRESEARFRQVAEHLSDAFWLSNPEQSEVIYVNPAYEVLYGQPSASLYADSQAYLAVVHPDDRERVQQLGNDYHDQEIDIEYRVVQPDGTLRWLWVHHKPIRNEQGAIIRYVDVAKDITQRKAYESQIEQLAYYDALTNLANRRLLHLRTRDLLETVYPLSRTLALLYLDLDRFKAVNDTLGHAVGDALLVQVAARLRESLRETDLLARLGGDEFAVVLPDTNEAAAIHIAQRLITEMERPFEVQGQTLQLSASIGIACAPRDGMDISTLLRHADAAMYRAKSNQGHYHVYAADEQADVAEPVRLEAELQQALEQQLLVLHYQPIFDLRRHQIIGVEALVRWLHPERGLLLPNDFLPLAEKRGSMRQVDRLVLQAAMQQSAMWHKAGQHLVVAVNVSVSSLYDSEFPAFIEDLLATTKVQPSYIMLEITERGIMRDQQALWPVLAELRSLGVRVALDHFGDGSTALADLKHLPVDVLKIDRGFVPGIGYDVRDESVVQALIALGHGFGMQVAIVGVERERQRTWLSHARCDLIQGYLVGRPVPPEQIRP